MSRVIEISELLLSNTNGAARRGLGLLAVWSLGIIECVANGALGAAEAVQFFFNAQNCIFVRKNLRNKTADEIMSRGVQLQDLFEALPEHEAQREFQRELETIRS